MTSAPKYQGDERNKNSRGSHKQIGRVVKVPFEMEFSSVPVPKNQWNCWNFSVHSSFPINEISVKLELSSVQVPKIKRNCRNLVP